MAKKKTNINIRQKSKRPAGAREQVSEVVDEVSEPFSLLNTLKQEGLANAMALFGMAGAVASGAAKNFSADAIRPQLYDLFNSMGFALREDVEKLEARIEELEAKLSASEFAALRGEEE